MKINGTSFDIEFCKKFTEAQLRKIYNGESEETLNELCVFLFPVAKKKKKDSVS